MKFDKQNNIWCLGNTLRNDSVLYVWAKNGNIYQKKDENKEINHLRLSLNLVIEKITLKIFPIMQQNLRFMTDLATAK